MTPLEQNMYAALVECSGWHNMTAANAKAAAKVAEQEITILTTQRDMLVKALEDLITTHPVMCAPSYAPAWNWFGPKLKEARKAIAATLSQEGV